MNIYNIKMYINTIPREEQNKSARPSLNLSSEKTEQQREMIVEQNNLDDLSGSYKKLKCILFKRLSPSFKETGNPFVFKHSDCCNQTKSLFSLLSEAPKDVQVNDQLPNQQLPALEAPAQNLDRTTSNQQSPAPKATIQNSNGTPSSRPYKFHGRIKEPPSKTHLKPFLKDFKL